MRLWRWISWLAFAPVLAFAADSSCERPPIAGEFGPQGVAVGDLSRTVRPGDDFFKHVNEHWIATTPIPNGYWDYGQTSALAATVDAQVKQLLDASLSTRAPRGSAAQEVGDAYASFLDAAEIGRRGLAPVAGELRRILASRTPAAIARWMADPTSSSLFAINVFPAERRPRVHLDTQNLNQPTVGLWNTVTYRGEDAGAKTALEGYRAYIAATLARAGVGHAQERAARVVALETRIAANLWPFEKLRDRRANYHPMTARELGEYAPGFPWREFLTARGVGDVTDIVLGTDTAVQAQARLFAATPMEDWASYLAFHWLQNQVDVLPEEFGRASWEFFGKTLSNAATQPPRAEIAARLASGALGMQVGRLYADRFVTPRTKSAAEEMIAYLRKALAERLHDAAWMDDATRAEALRKLDRFDFKIAYPRVWRDFSRVRIDRANAAGNLRRLRAADWEYQRRRLDPRVHDEPWFQTPQTVDASYSVLLNAIELPAAFLQPPYFDANADAAANFGAIGAIVGHEMGHAFDDQGVIYDSEGRMRDWWTPATLEEFHRRARGLVDQYSAFEPLPGLHLDGGRTIGENISDLAGVQLALRAYHLYRADHPCDESRDGLTGDQRFFTAWAQAWRYRAPESAMRWLVANNPHAPAPYRVNGVVQNIDEWYAAFGIGPADKLYVPPEKRVRLW